MVATENRRGQQFARGVGYEGELNSHARYKAYAAKAEDEGMNGAASLFRAAARAEQIHASNHARVIRHMGGEAVATILPFRVKSTLENLKTALGGEQNEIDSLYPKFLVHATSHSLIHQRDAVVCVERWSQRRRTRGSMRMPWPRWRLSPGWTSDPTRIPCVHAMRWHREDAGSR